MARDSYQGLLRLIFLLLDVPDGNREHQLARAHRLTRRALGRRPSRLFRRRAYPAARRWAIRHILSKEQRPWPDRLQWRLRIEPLPAGGDAEHIRSEIAALGPYDRAAYLLMYLDGLGKDELLGELRTTDEQLTDDPDTVSGRIQGVTGLTPQRQHKLLNGADFDPGWVRLSRRTHAAEFVPDLNRRHIRGACYAAVALLAVAAAIIPLRPGKTEGVSEQPVNEVVTVSREAWRDVDAPNYRTWPTTGELRTNKDLIRSAIRTWRDRGTGAEVSLVGSPPPVWWANNGAVQVLYAGRAGNRTTVLMLQDNVMAKYVRHTVDGGVAARRLTISPVEGVGQAQPGANARMSNVMLPLTSAEGGATRFLVPPWLTNLRVTPLEGDPAWHSVKVDKGGRTEPIKLSAQADCLDGLLIKANIAGEDGRGATRVFLYRPDASQTAQLFVTQADERRVVNPDTAPAAGIDTTAVQGALRGVLCEKRLLPEGFTPQSVELDIIGHGDLPQGQGPASLLHFYADYVGADQFNTTRELAAAILTGPRRKSLGAPAVQVIDSSRGSDSYEEIADKIIGTWWQADSGRWFYLVAGQPSVKRIKLSGGINRTVGGGFTAVQGPKGGKRKDLPTVRVRAVKPRQTPPPPGGGRNTSAVSGQTASTPP